MKIQFLYWSLNNSSIINKWHRFKATPLIHTTLKGSEWGVQEKRDSFSTHEKGSLKAEKFSAGWYHCGSESERIIQKRLRIFVACLILLSAAFVHFEFPISRVRTSRSSKWCSLATPCWVTPRHTLEPDARQSSAIWDTRGVCLTKNGWKCFPWLYRVNGCVVFSGTGESVHAPWPEPGLGRGDGHCSSPRLCVSPCQPSSIRPLHLRDHRHSKGTQLSPENSFVIRAGCEVYSVHTLLSQSSHSTLL